MTESPRRSAADALGVIFELSGSQREVFRVLSQATEPMDVQELAEMVRLHPNSVRDALAEMVNLNLVSSAPEQTSQRGRPRLLYEAVVKTDPTALASELVNFSAAVADQIPKWGGDPVQIAHSIGASWADRITKREHQLPLGAGALENEERNAQYLRQLSLLISNMGFEARPREEEGEIAMFGCPLLTGEVEGTELVCKIHEGMMSRLVGTLSAGRLAAELLPFATPNCCLAKIKKAT